MSRRSGYTLIELVVSMGAATLLMSGLASTLFLVTNVFDAQVAAIQGADAAMVQADLLRDLSRAKTFTSRSSDSVTFTVPDEDGDGEDDTLAYTFDAVAGELRMTRGGSTSTILTGVTASEFSFTQRDLTGSADDPDPFDSSDWGTRW